MDNNILDYDAEVNILIGENGSGKTTKLNSIARIFKSDKANNLIIINNVGCRNLHKFTKNHLFYSDLSKNFRNLVHKFIKNSFSAIDKGDLYNADFTLRQIRDILNYVGYDGSLYLAVDKKFIDHEFYKRVEEFEGYYTHFDYVHSYLNYIHTVELINTDQVLEIALDEDLYGNNENTIKFLFLIIKYWNAKFDVFFSKDDTLFKFDFLSSGEKKLITNIFFIATTIKNDKENILIIDEPEVSLHPKWQIEYIENISNLFYKHNLKIFIATHSPLILADLFFDRTEVIDLTYSIFHMNQNEIHRITNKDELSIEAIYWNVFGVLTPQNSFLSRQLNKLLNELHQKDITIQDFISQAKKFKQASIDRSQIETIEMVMAHALEKEG